MKIRMTKFAKEDLEIRNEKYKAIVESVEHYKHATINFACEALSWVFVAPNKKIPGESHRIPAFTGIHRNLFDPKSKTAAWVRACGVSVNPGEELDTDDLIGSSVIITIDDGRVVLVEKDES